MPTIKATQMAMQEGNGSQQHSTLLVLHRVTAPHSGNPTMTHCFHHTCLLRDKQMQYRCAFPEKCSYFSSEFLCSVLKRLMKSVLIGFCCKFCEASPKACVTTLTITLGHQCKLNLYQEVLKQRYFSK